MLGAAGLLKGYRATSHWYVRDYRRSWGRPSRAAAWWWTATASPGVGVTAGIDFGLTIGAALRGEEYARRVQLVIEHDPKPPFDSGSPEGAGAARVDDIRRRRAPLLTAAEQAARRAKSRLGT